MTPNLSLIDPAFVGVAGAASEVVYGTITGDGGGEINARIHRGLGFTLSDTIWVTTFELESTSAGALVLPVCFTENSDVCAETGAANDAMGFYLNDNWNGFQNTMKCQTLELVTF